MVLTQAVAPRATAPLRAASNGRTSRAVAAASSPAATRRVLPRAETGVRVPSAAKALSASSSLVYNHGAGQLVARIRVSPNTARAVRLYCTAGEGGKNGVLFVCLGNICRSPTAEAMFRAVTVRSGVDDKFDIDSCGTGGGNPNWYKPGGWSYHEGEDSDPRMTAAARQREVFLTSVSRPLKPSDFERFDYIIGMDAKNKRDILTAIDFWAEDPKNNLDAAAAKAKVSLMCEYCTESDAQEVPDPYYGGPSGFNKVLDLLEDASEGLLKAVQ